jgi:type IV pilus assembly protein PilF
MKLHRILIIICVLILQSCQHNNAEKDEAIAKKTKLGDAATYNTQLGMAYLKQGDRSRAKRKLLLALSQAPDSPNANASMAYFMEKSGEMDKATIYYKKAMAAAPGAGAQFNNYGAFLCRQGQYKQAEEFFLKAVQDIKYEHTAGAYENAGLCVMAIPDYVTAVGYFAKALEQDPSREQSLYELVRLEMKQDHVNEALSYLQKYPNLSLSDRTLLTLAVDVAHKAGKIELEADYQRRLGLVES